jgi:Rod binding domain-containing protein
MIELDTRYTPKELNPTDGVLSEGRRRRQQLKKATSEFEAIFINRLLKNMRRGSFNDEEAGLGKDVMIEIADESVARQLADSNALGIGEMLYRRLIERIGPGDEDTPLESEPVQSNRRESNTGTLDFGRYSNEIAAAAGVTGLSPHLLAAVIKQESGGNPDAISPKGAIGLMQLMPDTATAMGVEDPYEPAQNILGGARYLRRLLDNFRDLRLALAAYNAGPGRVRQYDGIPPFRETQNYVKRIMTELKTNR